MDLEEIKKCLNTTAPVDYEPENVLGLMLICGQLVDSVEKLQQERDEYREALEQIEKHRHFVESQSTGMRQYFDTESSLLAREALDKWKK